MDKWLPQSSTVKYLDDLNPQKVESDFTGIKRNWNFFLYLPGLPYDCVIGDFFPLVTFLRFLKISLTYRHMLTFRMVMTHILF